MSHIEFKTTDNHSATACIACKDIGDSKYFIQVENTIFRKCESCQSFSVIDHSMVNENYQNLSSDFWINYVEMNAGIESMISFAERCLLGADIRSFIDVGCGFGFVVDYFKKAYGAQSLGLEKSSYGKVGAEKLNINIRSEYSDEFCATNNAKFDVVYSSEVIEHVEDPLKFLKYLKELCSINGRIIITTPNSNFIKNEADDAITQAVLSAGNHYFVIHPNQLKKLMLEAGLCNVKIVEINERILATASVNSSTATVISENFDKSKYINYMMSLERIEDLIIRNSASVKLYKEFINMGDYASAQTRWDKLNMHFIEDRGFDIDGFDTSSLLHLNDLTEYTRSLPYYFGVLKFYRAMHLVNHAGRNDDMFYLFNSVTQILSKEIDLDIASFQESNSLIENAKFHTALGLLSIAKNFLRDGEKFSEFWRGRFNTEVVECLRKMIDKRSH